MDKGSMSFKCDRKKDSEIHENEKREFPIGENTEAAIRDGLLDFVGQTSLVGQGVKNLTNKDLNSHVKA